MKNGLRNVSLIKRGISVIAFCLILLLVLGRVYQVLSWKDGSGGYMTPVETFYGLEDDVVDAIFLGSSHCYCSVINSQLWDDYGIAGYSLSISGQDLAASYYWLKEALKTQRPKVVCLEMFGAVYNGYAVEGNLYRNTLPYHISPDYLQMIKDMIDPDSGSIQTEEGIVSEEDRSSFMAKWPIIHTRYKELQKQDFTGPDTLYIGFSAQIDGLRSSPITWSRDGEEIYTGDETMEMDEEEWLRRIIELTREKEVGLCLFLAPFSVTKQDQMRYNYVEELAEEEGIPFLNFVDLREELKFDTEQDFLDWGHVNYKGGEKVTAALGRFITQNYTIEDHQGDERYELWERDSATRAHEFSNLKLQQSTDIQYMLDLAAYAEDYTVIIATDGDYFRETDYLAERLEPMEIGEDFWEGGGVWLIENGEVTWKTTADTGDWFLERNGADIAIFRNEGANRIFVDAQNRIKVSDGINIIFYDDLLGKVVHTAGFSAPDGYICK
ncbi:MAG: hypothetical protein NC517_03065 [Firmicutes bacterium]|nr:hypothetical protein [Bacillota bacterium]